MIHLAGRHLNLSLVAVVVELHNVGALLDAFQLRGVLRPERLRLDRMWKSAGFAVRDQHCVRRPAWTRRASTPCAAALEAFGGLAA